MSKSVGNTVDPQGLIEKYGADTVRLFIIFAAPPEQSLEWSDSGVEGAYRFLKRLWTFAYENRKVIQTQNDLPPTNLIESVDWNNASKAQLQVFQEIYAVLEQAKYDYERQQFNTIVSGTMKILNLLQKIPAVENNQGDISAIILQQGLSILLRLLAPISPHITHQIWQDLQYQGQLMQAKWPGPSPVIFEVEEIELVVQVNGKLRAKISVPQDADAQTIENATKADPKIQKALTGLTIKKIIIVPKRLVNVVTG